MKKSVTEFYDIVDKSIWGDGPWLAEPDRAEWTDPDTGLRCLVIRMPSFGHWCGYVRFPRAHRFYKVNYNSLYALKKDIDVHGGLTYSGHITDEDDFWWVGFDCAHYMDLSLGSPWSGGTYRDYDFVRGECTSLAAALAVPDPEPEPTLVEEWWNGPNDHHQTLNRAWCGCGEWCYPELVCMCCERARAEASPCTRCAGTGIEP